MAEKKQKVAVFDVDGTIFRSSLLIQVVDAMIESGDFPEEAREEFEDEHQKWLDREGDYQTYIDAVVITFRKHLKGVPYKALEDAAYKVVDVQWKHTYRYTRDLLKDLKERGYFLLAVSH